MKELDYEDWCKKHDYDEETMNYLYGYCDDWVNENYKKGGKCVAITEWRDEEDCLLGVLAIFFLVTLFIKQSYNTKKAIDQKNTYDFSRVMNFG